MQEAVEELLPGLAADREPADVVRADLEEIATPLFACSLYAFANARALPELSSPPGLPGGARCDSLAALIADGASPIEARLDHYVDGKQHPFAALNSAFVTDGALVRAPRGVACEQPVHLVFASVAGARPQMSHPRVVIVAEDTRDAVTAATAATTPRGTVAPVLPVANAASSSRILASARSIDSSPAKPLSARTS